jgi:hypothetical protein
MNPFVGAQWEDLRLIINKPTKPLDCWHVYRHSVLFIDGKNNNDDGMFTGMKRSNDGK